MAKYREYKGLDLPAIDKEIQNFWEREKIFEKSISERPDHNTFVFFEGPPSANGKPGIHHVMARTVKDLFCRYHTMKGQQVNRKAGWDAHGLPVELKVEKELGITKEDIGTKITVEEYNQECRKTVLQFKDLWDDLTRKMGYWADLDNPYITFEKEYIESVWWLLKNLYDKDMLYKGYTVQPYSPAAGTGLSSHELNMPGAYKEVSDTTAVAQFKVKKNDKSAFLFDSEDEDIRILAWTTTPWTLPSNVALAVGKKIDYIKVKTFNPYTKEAVSVILASKLKEKWFKSEQWEANHEEFDKNKKIIPARIIGEYKGANLEWIEYDQLMPYVQPEEGDSFKVLIGDFVSTEDGTGIVHISPSFGSDDMKVGKRHGMGALTLVDNQGKFVDEVTDFAGRYVKDYRDEKNYKDVNIDICIKLKTDNNAFNVQKHKHNYPHCWRTDKPILYYPLDSWFIKASAYKERMVELNNTINWKPSHTGEKRFGNWLENLQDWNLSRSRFWGTPLPIWRTADGEEEICIGSIAQLTAEVEKANKVLGINQNVPEDLHKPYIDNIVFVSKSGKEMQRESDLIDVWFDSGAMPFAQWHYPFSEDNLEGLFPADFICEGVDQTRGWFYSLHAIAAMVKGSVSFKNVVSTGLVLDKNGVKMSKRLGNVIDPFSTLNKYGADATRWYMMTNAQPWDNLKFDLSGVDEVRRKFIGTLYNIYSFFSLYANIDGFTYAETEIDLSKRPEIDRWITSLLNTLVKEVDADYADYEPSYAGRKVQSFVEDHLSNWYVRLCRRRFWKGAYSDDKIAAYQTLYHCLVTVSKLMAPIAPFFGDWLYKNLNEVTGKENHVSVHLVLMPETQDNAINKNLEERMDYAQRISSLILSLRKKERLRVRQPLKKVIIPILNEKYQNQIEDVKALILSEVNIKEIEYITDTAGIIRKKIKPNFKTLGRKLGKNMKAAGAVISNLSQNEIAQIEKTNAYTLSVEGEKYSLTLEDFEITTDDVPGLQVATDKEITVALDITLTDELISEGISKEIINRIQNMRKSNDYNVTDRIDVSLSGSAEVQNAVDAFRKFISNEVLANTIEIIETVENGETFALTETLSVKINIKKS
ncbi:MAG: isoleucine--tRNA ligase [Saprospiraceae bacterium]